MIKLSTVIITLNEEDKIGQCLDSLQGIADEIVVVDSFSTDRTESICLSHQARFIKHAFEGYLAQIRFAVTQASFPHVLVIDADEALSPELKESILRVKQDFSCDAYAFNRLNYFCGMPIRHGAWYPDRKIRLWRTDKGSYGGLDPHYAVQMTPGSSQGFLAGDLLHYSYDAPEELFSQATKFARISAQDLHRKGKRVSRLGCFLRPVFRFVRDYFIKRGWLDGFPGFLIAMSAAQGNFQKYAFLYQLSNADENV